MSVRYKNKKSGAVVTYAQPQPRLERDKSRWERVEGTKQASKKQAASESSSS